MAAVGCHRAPGRGYAACGHRARARRPASRARRRGKERRHASRARGGRPTGQGDALGVRQSEAPAARRAGSASGGTSGQQGQTARWRPARGGGARHCVAGHGAARLGATSRRRFAAVACTDAGARTDDGVSWRRCGGLRGWKRPKVLDVDDGARSSGPTASRSARLVVDITNCA